MFEYINARSFPSYTMLPRVRILVFLGVFTLALIFFLPLPSPHLPLAQSRRPNGVIYILLKPSRIAEATVALRNVEDRFNRRLKYPYVLFMGEDEFGAITDEVRDKVSWITEGRATFAAISNEAWGVPPSLDMSLVNDSVRNIGFTLGYRSMCRYYSGWFWRHPALLKYDWLWRLDTDIVFHCDVPYDPIEHMISKKALYGFVQISLDATWVQPTLASNVSSFLAENAHIVPKDANLGFVWDGAAAIQKAMAGEAGSDEWTKECMYNNFEISHRSVWESEIYTKFFNFLDRTGGFFYERWGDSPVHSFGLAMSLRKDQVTHFSDLGYQHQGWPYECPEIDRCVCVKEGVAAGFNDGAAKWYNATAMP
jgi:mannosyltransferase